ncbi:hypothetical protein FSARC_6175 [Fusarium sarcochroum]|uniref:Uncharacterized protein n=1 Tax=Fusarium sarcochroum TaxID=1208366 RepID=A0A8H4X9N5_9HYPO|nr:hypothetical protein FSARC_6175 [Fusarium sarcochroum]
MNVDDPANPMKWSLPMSKKVRKEQTLLRQKHDIETIGVHREQLSNLSRGHYNMDLLAKIVSVKIDIFEVWCEIPGFQLFLKRILHLKEGTPSNTALLRTQEWAMNLAYQARRSQEEEDAPEPPEEPEEDNSASIVESGDAGEDGPHFEGDDLIAF